MTTSTVSHNYRYPVSCTLSNAFRSLLKCILCGAVKYVSIRSSKVILGGLKAFRNHKLGFSVIFPKILDAVKVAP